MSELGLRRLGELVRDGSIELGRGDIISKLDIEACPGPYPIYSSSAHGDGKFGEYGKFMFDEPLISWSIDGGGNFFYRPKHKFSITNVSGYLKIRSSDINYEYLYYLLALQHRTLSFDYTTKAHPSVIRKLYRVPRISRRVQDRIAEILSTVDRTIERTEALIAKLEKVKAGMMHDLFTRGVTPDGRLRPLRAEAPDLYKQTRLGWIPKEWELHRLSDIALFITSGSRGWAEYYSEVGPLFIRIGNLTREHINFRWDSVVRVSLPSNSEGKRTAVSPNDILISITADLGIVAVANSALDEAYVNQHIALVRLKSAAELSRFVGLYLTTAPAQKQFKKYDDSGAKSGLNLPTVGQISVALPKDSFEAQRIAFMADASDNDIEAQKLSLSKLHRLKMGLMHDLLTGRVRVPEKVAA